MIKRSSPLILTINCTIACIISLPDWWGFLPHNYTVQNFFVSFCASIIGSLLAMRFGNVMRLAWLDVLFLILLPVLVVIYYTKFEYIPNAASRLYSILSFLFFIFMSAFYLLSFLEMWLLVKTPYFRKAPENTKRPEQKAEGTQPPRHEYDVAFSYASEDHQYVDATANCAMKLGLKIFYDSNEIPDLWGRDLYQHLSKVYKDNASYCVIFISKHYANKLWTKHELKNAQARAFSENKEYILPVRFDQTEIPGITPTTAYLDLNKITPCELAELIRQKVNG